jgi:steroid delta-isomerase-like uncharacterized protein
VVIEENKSIVRRYYDELWNQWDVGVAEELISPDVTFRGSIGLGTRGLDGFKAYVELIREGFADFNNTIEDLIAEGDRVVARLSYRGTHGGTVLDIPPTGKTVVYSGVAIFRIVSHKIVDVWVLGDVHGLMEQLKGAGR